MEFQFSSSENQKAGIRLLPCFFSKMEASGIVATSFSSSCSCSASLWIFHLYWQRVTNFTRIMAVHSTAALSFILASTFFFHIPSVWSLKKARTKSQDSCLLKISFCSQDFCQVQGTRKATEKGTVEWGMSVGHHALSWWAWDKLVLVIQKEMISCTH